ncbi:MAG: dihydrodipicolinate synthase family protein [Gemmatimonadales bacterium]
MGGLSVRQLVDRLRHSVIPAVPVPFDREERIDTQALEIYSGWMARQAIGGVAVWAHTGRGLLLNDVQRSRVLEVWRGQLGDVPVICGVGVPNAEALPSDAVHRTARVIALSVTMAEQARHGGAKAVLVYPPATLRDLTDRDQRVVDLHRAVCDVGLPVIAFYLYGAAGGIDYSRGCIEEVLDLPGVIGIKVATLDSVITFQDIASVVSEHRDSLLITGEDRFLGYSLTLGAQAALIGMAASCTDRTVALLNAWNVGDLGAFISQTAALDEFARATFTAPMDGYVQRMLWALEADGVIGGEALDPFGPGLPRADRERVAAAVRTLRSK